MCDSFCKVSQKHRRVHLVAFGSLLEWPTLATGLPENAECIGVVYTLKCTLYNCQFLSVWQALTNSLCQGSAFYELKNEGFGDAWKVYVTVLYCVIRHFMKCLRLSDSVLSWNDCCTWASPGMTEFGLCIFCWLSGIEYQAICVNSLRMTQWFQWHNLLKWSRFELPEETNMLSEHQISSPCMKL